MTIIDLCELLWIGSPWVDARARPLRPLAYYVSPRQWAAIRRAPGAEYAIDPHTYSKMFGFPVYIHHTQPSETPLFLPEPTVRSMCGLLVDRLTAIERFEENGGKWEEWMGYPKGEPCTD